MLIKNDLFSLLALLKMQLTKDLFPERKEFVRVYLKERSGLLLCVQVLERCPFFKTFACLFGAAFSVGFSNKWNDEAVLALEALPGEKKVWDSLAPVLHDLRVNRVCLSSGFIRCIKQGLFLCSLGIVHPSKLLQLWRIFSRLSRHYPVYVVFRLCQAFLFYILFFREAAQKRISGFAISTDGNPHGCAALALGRRFSLSLVYVSHSPIVTNPASIRCDLGIFYGMRCLQDFLAAGAQIKKPMLVGFKNEPSGYVGDQKERLCIALSKDVNINYLLEVIAAAQGCFASGSITVRVHPQSLERPQKIASQLPSSVLLSFGNGLDDDLLHASLHVAGNSTVHLESLRRSVPSVYLPGLDHTQEHPISFLAEGQIPVWPSTVKLNFLEIKKLAFSSSMQDISAYFSQEHSFQEYQQCLLSEWGRLLGRAPMQ